MVANLYKYRTASAWSYSWLRYSMAFYDLTVAGSFFLMVLVQLWFGQAVYNYARGARVAIAPGGMSKDADPAQRIPVPATL